MDGLFSETLTMHSTNIYNIMTKLKVWLAVSMITFNGRQKINTSVITNADSKIISTLNRMTYVHPVIQSPLSRWVFGR